MPYHLNQPCPVCGLPIRPRDPVTSSFEGDASERESHVFIVHRRCESVFTNCATCGRELGEDEPRLATTDSQGRLRSYHFGHQPAGSGEAHTSP